jgi:hypothetical protein
VFRHEERFGLGVISSETQMRAPRESVVFLYGPSWVFTNGGNPRVRPEQDAVQVLRS